MMFHAIPRYCLTITMILISFPVYSVDTQTPIDSYRILNTYPHDSEAFTQGLLFYNGFLYESTGLRGRSSIRQVEIETGNVLQQKVLPKQYFGEGLTRWQNQLIQLTWQSQIGLVYQLNDFKKLKTFHYSTEGWGLTDDGQQLIMSDGTDQLYFLNPDDFTMIDQIQVHDQGQSITQLNELEYIDGEIFANIWHSMKIARISPKTGKVLRWLDLSGLSNTIQSLTGHPPKNVLNGIAYDAKGQRLFVTGKLWPYLFEIEIVPSPKLSAPCQMVKPLCP